MELLEEGLVPRLIALDEGDWKRFDTLAKILSSVRLLNTPFREQIEKARPYFEVLPKNHWTTEIRKRYPFMTGDQ